MSVKTIDGYLLRKIIILGCNELNKNRQLIDDLNVFPVPDGDTGSNMFFTLHATSKELININTPNASEVAKIASNGALRGARGNSGVILSQLFRGFHKGLEGNAIIDAEILANAFANGCEMAYKAVMKPKEGTILTIAKAIAIKTEEISQTTDNLEQIMKEVIVYANKILLKTTDMIPELKMANVVDSGGKGLISILEGAMLGIQSDEEVVLYDYIGNTDTQKNNNILVPKDIDIKFVYCTEFFVNSKNTDNKLEDKLKDFLDNNGDSIVAICDEDIIKIHLHTNNPGKVLEYALKIGEISNIKIENMKIQHTNKISFVSETNDTNKKDLGIISIATGEGMVDLFNELGVDGVIEGGQSMNPSADDILKMVDKVNSEEIILLPNNKNIILVSEQVVNMSNKKIHVIPTKNVAEGISACINFDSTIDANVNIDNINKYISSIKTGQVTVAIRDTISNDNTINKGDFIGIVNDKINVVNKNLEDCLSTLINSLVDENSEVVSIYYGIDITEEKAKNSLDKLRKIYKNLEIELFYGGQSLYHYIFSVE